MGDKGIMVVGDELGEGMQCSDHPYRSNPGGICALCLQEKLGKLVSSSNTNPFFSIPPLPSSSSSPSFRSNLGGGLPAAAGDPSGSSRTAACGGGSGRTKIPFLSGNKKKKSSGTGTMRRPQHVIASGSTSDSSVLILQRSKSVAPRSGIINADASDSPRKKSFWSFLYPSSSSSSTATSSSSSNKRRSTSSSSCGGGASCGGDHRDLTQVLQQQQLQAKVDVHGRADDSKEEDQVGKKTRDQQESPSSGSQASSSSFGRKVARSRSVGCGSRSFSGDFLERISTGFGDCTLRRVESHRESGKAHHRNNSKISLHRHDLDNNDDQRIKERVKCGGIFGGFGVTASSSASSYWISAAAAAAVGADGFETNNTMPAAMGRGSGGAGSHGGRRSWGWAFSSPIRAFRPASSSSSKPYAPANVIATINTSVNSGGTASSNATSKVGANRSLLAVGS